MLLRILECRAADLSASAHMPNMSDGRYSLEIDLKPALSEEELDARILRDFAQFQNRDFINRYRNYYRSK